MSTNKKGQIDSAKAIIREVFSQFWFRIPDYQRSYVWGKDELSELIDDVNYAAKHNPEGQYFLGSMVLRKVTRSEDGVSFAEHEILDGQQRLTTLMLLLAVIRDRIAKEKLKQTCREKLFQEENPYDNVPGRNRIVYQIRDNVGDFIERFVKPDGATLSTDLARLSSSKNLSLANMAAGLSIIHSCLNDIERFETMPPLSTFLPIYSTTRYLFTSLQKI